MSRITSSELRYWGSRIMSPLAVGLAIAAYASASTKADSAIPRVQSAPYECPDDYLNKDRSPIQKEPIFDEQNVGVPPYDQANLVVVHDDRAYDLEGKSVKVDSTCVGTSFEQFQIGNSSYGDAVGVTVEFSMPDDPAGNVLNPHNPAENEILKVTQSEVGSYSMPDKTEKPVDNYMIREDGTSVSWSLPAPLSHGQQEVYRVYYTSKKSVVDQDYNVSVTSATPEINPADNGVHFQKDIYPAQLNPADRSDQPRFSNGRIRRVRTLGKHCIIRPIRISAPKSAVLDSQGLMRGRVITDVYYSKKRDLSHATHKRIKVPFAAITPKKPLDVPVRICDTPGQKYVDARVGVTASNTHNNQPFLKGAHLVRTRRAHGQLHRVIAWTFNDKLRYPE